jgi:protein gp37
MSDLFHDEVPLSFIREVFSVMEEAERHTFQVLTKRHERLNEIADQLSWPANVWLGVSVENQHWAEKRIPVLVSVPSAVRFLSVEPLLKRVALRTLLVGIDWVIVGGESGNKSRPVDPEWVREIRDDCQDAKVPFFFKQWGGRTPSVQGCILDGEVWNQYPRPG